MNLCFTVLVHVLVFPLGKVICPHHIFRHRHLKVSSSLWWKLDSVLIGRNIYPQPVLPLDSHFPFLMNSLLWHFIPFQMRSQLKAWDEKETRPTVLQCQAPLSTYISEKLTITFAVLVHTWCPSPKIAFNFAH